MSKKMMKLLALGLSVMLVFSLAACGGSETPDTSSEGTSSEPTVETAESAAPVVESAAEDSTAGTGEETEAPAGPAAEGDDGGEAPAALPQSKAELIDAYNTGGASGLSCTSMAQQVASGRLWMGDKSDEYIDLRAADQTALLAKFEKTANGGASLPTLSAGNVASANVSGTTVTFTLNDASATHDDVAQGVGGYVNIIDHDRTLELVEGVKAYANLPNANVKVDSASHSLSGGTLTVEFNSDFTQVTSVKFTAKQHVQATMTYLIAFKISADVNYDLTAEYR